MKNSIVLLIVISFVLVSCSNGFSAANLSSTATSSATIVSNPSGTTSTNSSTSDVNVMAVQVGCGYANEPCVSVKVCQHGTSSCVTINNILLDTGSYGLRIFSSMVSSLGLPKVASGSGTLAECVSYMDNSSDWGPIATADLVLGSETASNVRIQLIDSTLSGRPSSCTNPDDSPSNAGFNGILGVGLFVDDCGPGCAQTAQNETYYSCYGSNCSNVAVLEANQVSNPVAFLSTDNNGIILQLPSIGASGASSAQGYLVLGIGTRSNNNPVGATVLTADGNGNFGTTFQGSSYSGSFIDSGSNGLYFPQPSSLSTCGSSSDVSGWFCPSSVITYSATQNGNNGVGANVSFQIGNAQTLLGSGLNVFNDIGAPNSSGFDWGLPFFLGRTVFIGLDGTSSSLGSGAYWAY